MEVDRGGKIYTIHKEDLLYPETSYLVNGVLIDVYKKLGGGHLEKVYHKAVEIGLNDSILKYKSQHYVPLTYKNKNVGKYFLDFYIEGPDGVLVLELKRGKFVTADLIEQTKKYLIALNLQLAVVGCFTFDSVVIKRVINEY
ncbi:GxxExxY protein [Candidatus Kuenenbacteria bacterium]|nr:GxxExxY protein [Candidatus Kuenenbacteria bacterium]